MKYQRWCTLVFPRFIKESGGVSEEFEITDSIIVDVSQPACADKTQFRLFSNVDVMDVGSYDERNQSKVDSELRHVYRILQLAIAYVTNDVVIPDERDLRIVKKMLLSKTPKIENNFLEQAELAGVKLKHRVSSQTSMPVEWGAEVKVETLYKVISILRRTALDVSNVKYEALEHYRSGLLTLDNPYPSWYLIIELARNCDFGILEELGSMRTPEGEPINIDFLTEYSHFHRHSAFNKSESPRRHRTYRNWSKYIDDPKLGEMYFKQNFDPVMDVLLNLDFRGITPCSDLMNGFYSESG